MKLKFGKYKGMTVEQAIKTDLQYCKGLTLRKDIEPTLKREIEDSLSRRKVLDDKHNVLTKGMENGNASGIHQAV